MATDRQRLQATLDELHAQLSGVESLDPEIRASLRSALADIQATLERKATAAAAQSSISERLSEAARHFEGSHPTLSGTLGSVIDTLGRMGI